MQIMSMVVATATRTRSAQLATDSSLQFQSEEPSASRRADDDGFGRAVAVDRFNRRDPIGRAQVGVLFETVAGRGRGPGNHRSVGGGQEDFQQRRARCLHSVKRPESAAERIISATHPQAGVVLADGAADGIKTARTRAATTRDFIPVNRVVLAFRREWREKKGETPTPKDQ